MALLLLKEEGLFCPQGNFYVDALCPVPLNLVTHAHGDHAKKGSGKYICTQKGLGILQYRLGQETQIQPIEYQQKIKIGKTWVSFHPAGHILGSAQIRIEYGSEVWVASGDYKRAEDSSCDPFEVLSCNTFITESTFALPIYQWQKNETIAQQIINWWEQNQKTGHASVLLCYALGKAERILNLLHGASLRPIYLHGAMLPFVKLYKEQGIALARTLAVNETQKGHNFQKELILAPLSVAKSPWMKRFLPYKLGCASGWMGVRGTRRRMNFDKGFVLSDHADWKDLIQTILETNAKNVIVTHGNVDPLARYLSEKFHISAYPLGGYEGLFSEDD